MMAIRVSAVRPGGAIYEERTYDLPVQLECLEKVLLLLPVVRFESKTEQHRFCSKETTTELFTVGGVTESDRQPTVNVSSHALSLRVITPMMCAHLPQNASLSTK